MAHTLYVYRGHSDQVCDVAWSPDGKYITSVSADGVMQIWEATSGKKVSTFQNQRFGETVACSPGGKYIASRSDPTVEVWEAANGRRVLTCQGQVSDYSVVALAWSPSGKYIAAGRGRVWGTIPKGGIDSHVEVWEAANGRSVLTCQRDFTSWPNAVAWSPDGKYIVAGTSTVQVSEAANGRSVLTYREHSSGPLAVAWSPDGKYIASSAADRTVRVWEATIGTDVLTYQGHSKDVPDVRQVRSGVLSHQGHSDPVIALTWSPDDKYIASGSFDDTVQVWRVSGGAKLLTYQGHSSYVATVAWSPNGKYIASGGGDHTVQVWQAPQ